MNQFGFSSFGALSLSFDEFFEYKVLRAIGLDGYMLGPLRIVYTKWISQIPHHHSNPPLLEKKLRKLRFESFFELTFKLSSF